MSDGQPALDLPDWNAAICSETFDCSPVKVPLAQATLKDGNTQRVTALGGWKAAPPAAAAVPMKPTIPATLPAAAPAQQAVQPAACSQADAENNAGGGAAAALEPPRSVRRTHTPGRTGLTARAVRMPSRLGATPGAKAATQFEVPLSARAAVADAAPATGKNLKSILKRLNFSATKARVAAGGAAAAAHAGDEAPATELTATAPAPAPGPAAQSTIKQLRFDVGATPAVPTAAKPGGRHVSFDATTVSPAPRGSRLGRSTSAPASVLRTPEPPIQEEASGGSSEDGGAGAGSVNSAAAGHTPYDRRLSSLFRKYQVAGTPELAEADLDDLVADGVVRSPSWKRLSSASVPESIKELAKKYTSDGELSLQGLSISPAPAAAAGPAAEAETATPLPAKAGTPGDGSSPAMAPTPHDLVNSMMKRNELFESSPAELPASAARAAAAASSGVAQQAAASAGPLSPGSAVAQLLAPVLLATIKEIDGAKQAQQASPAPAAAASPSVGSPAEFYGFPLATELSSTPQTAAAPRSASVDGVPRNAEGIPTVTPHTVTVRRGSSGAGLAAVLEEDDDLAANLFDCFSPLSADHAFTPPEGDADASPGSADGEGGSYSPLGDGITAAGPAFGSFSAGHGDAAAATPAADAGADFSFFPAAPGGQAAGAAVVGATPELPGGAAAAAGASYVSPEILGFYEQAQRAAGSSQAGTSSQAAGLGTPALPRSIIKSGRPLNEAGTPVLGHAQRAPTGEAPPHTITKELQALMRDLRLEDPAELEEMGTVSTLSPVRATGSLRGFLGGLARAITPVRRSARKKATGRPLEAMLEETGFSYVPNAALMPEDAPPKQEAAEAKAARKAARQGESQVSAGEPSLADMAAEDGQPEVSSAAPRRRYSTRSAGRVEAAEEQQQQQQGEPAEAATTAAATPETAPAAGRRMSLRRLRTPMQPAHMEGVENEGCTPAAPAAADTPVAQDASPQLAESPIYSRAAEAATPVEAATPGERAYSLRPSTVQKTRQSLGTPLQPANTPSTARQQPANTPSATSGKKERRGSKPQLSPTEQGIRASLRRSARKSRGAAS